MSIRMLAVELYRAMREIEELEKRLANLAPSALAQREELENRLRVARAEGTRIKAILEGAKES